MAPSRPSGASKKKAANKEGGQRHGRDRGGGLSHLPRNPLDLAANQHCRTRLSLKSSVKTVDGWLPGGSMRPFLDEKWPQLQRQKMVNIRDLIARRPLHEGLARMERRGMREHGPGFRFRSIQAARFARESLGGAGAAGARPTLPAVQHLAELAGRHRRSSAGLHDLVGVGWRVGREPVRLRVLAPAACLRPPFSRDVVPREIASRKCERDKDNQDDGLHNELQLYPPSALHSKRTRR